MGMETAAPAAAAATAGISKKANSGKNEGTCQVSMLRVPPVSLRSRLVPFSTDHCTIPSSLVRRSVHGRWGGRSNSEPPSKNPPPSRRSRASPYPNSRSTSGRRAESGGLDIPRPRTYRQGPRSGGGMEAVGRSRQLAERSRRMTPSSAAGVPLCDIQAQYRELQPEFDAGPRAVCGIGSSRSSARRWPRGGRSRPLLCVAYGVACG